MLNGGVVSLRFDSLDGTRVVSFVGANGPCQTGNCKCLLKTLHQFTQLKQLVINDELLTASLGRGAAPYTQGLPPSLVSLTIVLHRSFLRWLHGSFRQDYSLANATPHLRFLQIGELSSLEDKAKSRLKIDHSSLAAPAFLRLLGTLPSNLEVLDLAPSSHELTPNLLPASLTKTTMRLRWKTRFETLHLPQRLVSLNVQIKLSDTPTLEKHAKTMFPDTLTDLTVFLKHPINDETLNSNNSNQMAVDAAAAPPAPQWIKDLPRSLNSLHLHNVDHVRLADLPTLLTHLRLTTWWPAKGHFDHKDWRSEYLTYVRIQRWEPVSQEFLTVLPRTVTQLVLKTDKATRVSKLPDSIVRLRLPSLATFSSHKWPSNLTSLKVSRLTTLPSDALVDLPKTVTSLSLSCPPSSSTLVHDYFKEMPRHIKHLTLWNRKLDNAVFSGLKESQLESFEIYTGESRHELLAVDMPQFTWKILENLPSTLTRLRLPVISSQKIRLEGTIGLSSLADLCIPHIVVDFEDLQTFLVHCPNLQRILAKQFKFENNELEAARQLLQSNPLITLQFTKSTPTAVASQPARRNGA